MHGYPYGGYILTSGFVLTLFGMVLWFRDIVIEWYIFRTPNKRS